MGSGPDWLLLVLNGLTDCIIGSDPNLAFLVLNGHTVFLYHWQRSGVPKLLLYVNLAKMINNSRMLVPNIIVKIFYLSFW